MRLNVQNFRLLTSLQNPNIGKNLYLHPVNVMTGVFSQDVRPWEGGILTTVVNTFENMDGKGHGAKLECLSMMVCRSHCSLPVVHVGLRTKSN